MSGRRGARRVSRGLRALTTMAAALGLLGPGCWRGEPDAVDDPSKMTITMRSPAFGEGGMIPKECTCDGAGGSPPLEWSGVPEGARGLVLLADDPDAPMGTFSHWLIANLPPGVKGLRENVPAEAAVPSASMVSEGEARRESAAVQGKNDFGKIGYGGPCPPSGTHRYFFRVYALDAPLPLSGGAPTRAEVLRAMEGHILAEGRLLGRYARSR